MMKKFFCLFSKKLYSYRDCEYKTAVNEINNNEGKRFVQEPSILKVILIQLHKNC